MKKKIILLKMTLLAAILIITGSTNVWGQYSGTGTFSKITSVGDLSDGYYVILNENDQFLMSSDRSGNATGGFFISKQVTVSSGVITNPPTNNVWKIETNGSGKTIYNEVIEKYVGWRSGNAASIEDSPEDLSRWTFSYVDSKFTVNNVGTSARQLSYNASNPRFAAYGNTNQEELQLYKLEDTSPCTPSNLSFTEQSVTKNITDDAFTITATSLNETTPIVYSTSEESVAMINTTTGEVTLVGIGTATITATQAAGTHAGTDYCANTDSYLLTVESLAAPVAEDASNISETGFTANWTSVAGATGYELSVYSGQNYFEGNFDDLKGTGGNDGAWSGAIAVGPLDPPYGGWTLVKAFIGNNCMKLGTGSLQGIATTPALGITGNATLTFRAGAWDGNNEQTELTLEITGGGTLDQSSVEMVKGAFSVYTVVITGGTATTQISFKGKQASNSRFFLDDIKVSSFTTVTGSPFTITGQNTTSHAVTGLTNNTTYYYMVKAIAGGGIESGASNEIEVTTKPGPDTGLDKATTGTHVYASHGKVYFSAAAGQIVEIYNVAGQKLISKPAVDGLNSVDVAATGVVFVKIGERVTKVIL